MTAGQGKSALVIGAGILGACTAYRLREDGFDVTLIERANPGEACSFGNAGRIATAFAHPKSVPGLLRKVPRMLGDRNHPLKTSLRFVAGNLRWFTRFARAGTPQEVERITAAMHALLSNADAAVDRLTAALQAQDVINSNGVMFIYRDSALAEAVREEMEAASRRGLHAEYMTGDQLRDINPAIPPAITSGYFKAAERFVRNPLELTQRIVNAFISAGGTLINDEVTGLERRAGNAPRVRCRHASFEADKVVIAAGAWSARLAAGLGIPLLLVAERGYHACFPKPNVNLKIAVHYGDRLISITPMTGGLRTTSGAEFADPDAPPNWGRRDVIVEGARSLFPQLNLARSTRWMGSRPSTPDTLPIIGASLEEPDVLFATGHGTLGLTLAALTSELIADAACNRPATLDVTPYRPDRFAG